MQQSELKGLLLTSDLEESGGFTYVRYFGRADSGPFEVILTDEFPRFFVGREDAEAVPGLPGSRQETPLCDFDGRPVMQLQFQTPSAMRRAKERLRQAGMRTFESDVPLPERLLMDRGIFAGVHLSEPAATRQRGNLTQWINPRMQPLDEPAAGLSLSVLSLDIETSKQGSLLCLSLHLSHGEEEHREVLMTRPPLVPEASGDFDLHCLDPERAVLEKLLQRLEELDPDLIIGWNVVGFDLRFLLSRMDALGVPPLFGRNRSPLRLFRGGSGCHCNGRVVLDIPMALRTNFFGFEYWGLERVAQEVLGEGKLIESGAGKWEEIERQYAEDPSALARYNMQDSVLVTRIMQRTGILDLLLKRSRISGLLLPRVGGSTAAFDHRLLPALHKTGRVAPDVQDVPRGRTGKGGHVFEPEAGLYDHVVVLDFKSLYPSIMMTFCIDPIARLFRHEKPVRTPAGITFSSSRHALPGILQELLLRRQEARAAGDSRLSQAIKILMNSFYGVMGSPGCRFYHPDLPDAITGSGRRLLLDARDFLQSEGYSVLYGDTDSVFVRLKDGEEQDYPGSGAALAEALNRYLGERILAEYGRQSHLEIEFEKYYRRFFLPPSRSGQGGSKKRYAGVLCHSGKETVSFTGMEYVRSDWTRLAKNFQMELYRRIFYGIEPGDWLRQWLSDLRAGRMDEDLIYHKRLTRPPEEYTRTTPPHVKAALLEKERHPRRDQRRIRYVMTAEGPVPASFGPQRPDYEHYVEKQLKPLADTILPYVGSDFNTLATGGRQGELFS